MATFKRTKYACFMGIFTQAVVSNMTALLFVPLMTFYNLSYVHLGVLVAAFFLSQVLTDLVFSPLIDRIGYRRLVLPAALFSFAGLAAFALTPQLFPGAEFTGICLATVLFAFSCGLMEVMLSPIIVSLPGSDRNKSTGHLHSVYAWGQVAAIVLTTLALFLAGTENWQYVTAFWALVPLLAFFLFLTAPLPEITPADRREKAKSIFKNPFFILAALALFFGAATEVTMNQWASTFMEKGLQLPKIWGDLLGMCGFAVMLGLGRTLYGVFGGRVNIAKLLPLGSAFSVVCYLTVAFVPYNIPVVAACVLCGLGASLLWPGIIAASGERFPLSGAWMFGILALTGDLGAAFGPYLAGQITDLALAGPIAADFGALLGVTAEQAALRLGLAFTVLFPLLAFVCHILLFRLKKQTGQT